MTYVFSGCTNLETLDLSSWNTSLVTKMGQMFYNCGKLTTIYVGSGWKTSAVTSSTDMFTYCTKLVGGAGTTYNSSHTDVGYARIDGGTSTPGYLTAKFKRGDVNMDGEVNVSDVTMLVSMILGNTAPNAAANVNGDTDVNVSDVTALVSIILGQN